MSYLHSINSRCHTCLAPAFLAPLPHPKHRYRGRNSRRFDHHLKKTPRVLYALVLDARVNLCKSLPTHSSVKYVNTLTLPVSDLVYVSVISHKWCFWLVYLHSHLLFQYFHLLEFILVPFQPTRNKVNKLSSCFFKKKRESFWFLYLVAWD